MLRGRSGPDGTGVRFSRAPRFFSRFQAVRPLNQHVFRPPRRVYPQSQRVSSSSERLSPSEEPVRLRWPAGYPRFERATPSTTWSLFSFHSGRMASIDGREKTRAVGRSASIDSWHRSWGRGATRSGGFGHRSICGDYSCLASARASSRSPLVWRRVTTRSCGTSSASLRGSG